MLLLFTKRKSPEKCYLQGAWLVALAFSRDLVVEE